MSLAKKLGYQEINRGKHPTYASVHFTASLPISIPGHPTISGHTAASILDDLELAIYRWAERLDELERVENEAQRRKALPPATVRKNSHS